MVACRSSSQPLILGKSRSTGLKQPMEARHHLAHSSLGSVGVIIIKHTAVFHLACQMKLQEKLGLGIKSKVNQQALHGGSIRGIQLSRPRMILILRRGGENICHVILE